jgi:hypothetical protein
METVHCCKYFISLVGLHYFYYILFIFHEQSGDDRNKYIREEEIVLNAVPLAAAYLPFAIVGNIVISLVFSLKVHNASSSFVQ